MYPPASDDHTLVAYLCQLVRSMIRAVIQLAPLVGAVVVLIVVGFLIRKYGRIDPWM